MYRSSHYIYRYIIYDIYIILYDLYSIRMSLKLFTALKSRPRGLRDPHGALLALREQRGGRGAWHDQRRERGDWVPVVPHAGGEDLGAHHPGRRDLVGR